MMGIKEQSEMPRKAKNPERKKYIVVKNHVREIPNLKATANSNESDKEENKDIQENKNKKIHATPSDSDNSASGICEKDLKELRIVYNKCKAIMKKMEMKYGHLLQIDEQESSKTRKRRLSSVECQCTLKRKIVYDDDGKEIYQNIDEDHHICPKNIQKPYNNSHTISEPLNVNIESETAYELPDDINELTKISKEPNLSKYIQYQVIQKIKNIHIEKINLLRFEKPTLIEKAKSNYSEIFEFHGSNLSSLPGYPVEKIQ